MCVFIKGLDQTGHFHFICMIFISEHNSFWCRVLLESTLATVFFLSLKFQPLKTSDDKSGYNTVSYCHPRVE